MTDLLTEEPTPNAKDFLSRIKEPLGVGKIFIITSKEETMDALQLLSDFRNISEMISDCCDFKDGVCLVNRERDKYIKVKNPLIDDQIGDKNGCCGSCAKEIGYLRRIPEGGLNYLSSLWDPDKGFLGESGCKIPLSSRSNTCAGFLCDPAKNNSTLTDFEKRFLDTMYKTNG